LHFLDCPVFVRLAEVLNPRPTFRAIAGAVNASLLFEVVGPCMLATGTGKGNIFHNCRHKKTLVGAATRARIGFKV
jgi:hypothetical protein